jgi:hypothetical protein
VPVECRPPGNALAVECAGRQAAGERKGRGRAHAGSAVGAVPPGEIMRRQNKSATAAANDAYQRTRGSHRTDRASPDRSSRRPPQISSRASHSCYGERCRDRIRQLLFRLANRFCIAPIAWSAVAIGRLCSRRNAACRVAIWASSSTTFFDSSASLLAIVAKRASRAVAKGIMIKPVRDFRSAERIVAFAGNHSGNGELFRLPSALTGARPQARNGAPTSGGSDHAGCQDAPHGSLRASS